MAMKYLVFLFTYLVLFCASAQSELICKNILIKKPTLIDFQSDWGTMFLSPDDPAWKDPEYLSLIQEYTVPTTTGMSGRGSNLLSELQKLMRSLGSEGEIIDLTHSGTAANNLLYSILMELMEYNKNYHGIEIPKEKLNPKFLMLGHIYNYTTGKIRQNADEKDQLVNSPQVLVEKTFKGRELKQQEKKEEKALKEISRRIKSKASPYAAVFLELFHVGYGQMFTYRPEFLKKLQKLSEEENFFIFADEVMTGGGRTGKFWSYQHFEGFTPDLITFGKGLLIQGVFKPSKSKMTYFSYPLSRVTSPANPLQLVQSINVLRTILDRNLIENAEESGNYLKQKLEEFGKDSRLYYPVQNIGLFLNSGLVHFLASRKVIYGYGDRMLPPLTLTKEEIDNLFDDEVE